MRVKYENAFFEKASKKEKRQYDDVDFCIVKSRCQIVYVGAT